MKKFVCIMTIVGIMLFCGIIANAATYSGMCGENVRWTLDTNTKVIRIYGNGDMKNYSGYGDAPWFCYYEKISYVSIEEGVTSIGDYAFYYCHNITDLTIAEGVVRIGDGAFTDCSDISSLIIPQSVTSIGDDAFYSCDSLTSINIPSEVLNIGNRAFATCSSVTDINVDIANEYYVSKNGVLFDKNTETLIQYACGKSNSVYTIPDSVRKIGEYAFATADGLLSVEIPNSVTEIGNYAFYKCEGLKYLAIPNGITAVNKGTFYSCSNLVNITLPDGVTSIGENAFYTCYNMTEITIPASMTDISANAFTYCTALTDVYYGGSETDWSNISIDETNNKLTNANIHYSENCVTLLASGVCGDNLTWTLDDTGLLTVSGDGDMSDYIDVTSVPWYSYRKSVKTVAVKDAVTGIGSGAFYWCTSLKSLTIETELERIGEDAFYNCSSLADIELPDSIISIDRGAFCRTAYYDNDENWEGDVLYIGNHLIEAKQTISGDYSIKDGTKTISGSAFGGCERLTHITIPKSVVGIGYLVFYHCTNLESISVDENNQYYTSKNGVLFDKNLTCLIVFPAQNSETVYEIPSSVTSIENYAFNKCSKLESISIPNDVTTIGQMTFSNCTKLESISIPSGVTKIDNGAFSGCSSLVSVIIPSCVTNIDGNAFINCSKLSTVTIPDTVKEIGYYAFRYTNLTDVYYMGSEEDWGKIVIDDSNEDLINAIIHYNYLKPTITAFDVRSINSYAFISLSTENFPSSATVYAATFNADGRMCELQPVLLDNSTGEAIVMISGIDRIKVFVWNLSTLTPLCESKTYRYTTE